MIQSFQQFAVSQISGLKFQNTIEVSGMAVMNVTQFIVYLLSHVCVCVCGVHTCTRMSAVIKSRFFYVKSANDIENLIILYSAVFQTLLKHLYPLLCIFDSFCICNHPNTILLSLFVSFLWGDVGPVDKKFHS